MNLPTNLGGECACQTIRYRLTASPLIVHAFQSSYRIDDVWPAESKERLRRNRTEQA
jgi:hypothetical protein